MRAVRIAFVSLFVTASSAHAEALKLQMQTRVPEGQRPRIRMLIGEPVERIAVELVRDDAEKVQASFQRLRPGSAHEVLLPGDPGRHRYTGTMAITQNGETREDALDFEAIVISPLKVTVDRAKVDLAARRLEMSASRPLAKVEMKVLDDAGGTADVTQDLGGRTEVSISWPKTTTAGEVARIDIKVFDKDGFYTGVSLLPWAVRIPHEEVGFATDSAAIAPAEAPKLQASLRLVADALAKHRALGPIKLFVAGHTDTVGNADYNLKLSQRRAQAIATWFRKHGLRLPIAFEGFGEHAPLVATPDETDEARNRRVDYILAIEEPALKATRFRAGWKRVP